MPFCATFTAAIFKHSGTSIADNMGMDWILVSALRWEDGDGQRC